MVVTLSSFLFLIIISCVILYASGNNVRPNIVLVIADDLGYDDVSFHGSDLVQTPNIDALAMTGIALDRFYSHCVCTPSRAALLSGKFAHTTGMQGYPLTNGEDRGLPLSVKILPEYLKDLGYATYLVGKWHVGQSRTEYLPTSRGFDSHFGFRGGYISYYEYLIEEIWQNVGTVYGLDLYRNLSAAWDVEGYITDVFTEQSKNIIKSHDVSKPLFLMVGHSAPHSGNDGALLEAPPEVVRSMRYVESAERRIYTAMMKKLDDSVGDIVEALSEKNILDNMIIVFIADNGGMPKGVSVNYASNWPLRGSKFTPFEGGVRVAGLLWTSNLTSTNHLWNGYMHVVDWLPTLLKGIGAEIPPNIDGKNLWNEIISNNPSKRDDFFEIFTNGEQSFNAIVSGEYKLIVGHMFDKEYTEHLGGDFRGVIGCVPCYEKAVENSKTYKVLRKMGKLIDVQNTTLREEMRVKCNSLDRDKSACVTSNGTASCLFNIIEDPCETRNLYEEQPEIVNRLLIRLRTEMKRIMERPHPICRDLRALPSLHNYTWVTWANHLNPDSQDTCVH